MRINNNLMAMNTHRQLGNAQNGVSNSMKKLSSGLRINSAADDAAGLAISEKMRGQIRGLDQASSNAQDSISLIQTAEGALNETQSILQRMRELAVQAANDTNVEVDRDALQAEVHELSAEITRISDTTEFNTQNLLGGNFEGTFHIGANEEQNVDLAINEMSADALGAGFEDEVTVASGDFSGTGLTSGTAYSVVRFEKTDIVDSSGNTDLSGAQYGIADADGNIYAVSSDGKDFNKLSGSATIDNIASYSGGGSGSALSFTEQLSAGVKIEVGSVDASGNVDISATGGISISSQADADAAIETFSKALETVSAERSKLGAMQNRLDHTINNLDTSSENLQAAESRIRDVDMAKEMMEMTKNNILQQAAQSMLAQANSAPQGVLQLLG